MPPKGVKRKATNGYKMPDKISEGTVLATINKKQFRVGKSIGTGGFGEIYLCSDEISKPVSSDAPFALKIEPHENGPLFVEINFYIRAASPDSVEAFKTSRGLKSLGMPSHRGSGSTTINGEKYRFLVMDRFGSDLQKIFDTGKFSERVTYNLAIKIIDILEYIHSQDYVHKDIKAQNLLLGYGKGKENDVYLVDFGLAAKYKRPNGHLEYKPDPKKAHDGTIEYTSRDAHIGTHSRRSDLEILGYNLVHWMSGSLPWMSKLTDPNWVHNKKKEFMEDPAKALGQCFGSKNYPESLLKYLLYVQGLDFSDEPDYKYCRNIFSDALKKAGYPLDGKLNFSKIDEVSPATRKREATPKVDSASKKRAVKSPSVRVSKVAKKSPVKKVASKSPCSNGAAAVEKGGLKDSSTQTSPAFVKAVKAARRAKNVNTEVQEFAKEAMLAAKKVATNGAKRTPVRKAKKENRVQDESPNSALSNPTPAMAAILAKRAAEAGAKDAKKRKTARP